MEEFNVKKEKDFNDMIDTLYDFAFCINPNSDAQIVKNKMLSVKNKCDYFKLKYKNNSLLIHVIEESDYVDDLRRIFKENGSNVVSEVGKIYTRFNDKMNAENKSDDFALLIFMGIMFDWYNDVFDYVNGYEK